MLTGRLPVRSGMTSGLWGVLSCDAVPIYLYLSIHSSIYLCLSYPSTDPQLLHLVQEGGLPTNESTLPSLLRDAG
jgi:hypothetical protein